MSDSSKTTEEAMKHAKQKLEFQLKVYLVNIRNARQAVAMEAQSLRRHLASMERWANREDDVQPVVPSTHNLRDRVAEVVHLCEATEALKDLIMNLGG